jgi:hypothetical protein
MRKIIYTRPDGGVSVVSPAKNVDDPLQFSEEDRINRAMLLLPPEATNVQVVDEASLPKDRTFRNGWKQNGAAVEHDIEKCRELHKEHLRRVRSPLLEELDVQYMRAMEKGDTATMAAVVSRKEELRDITSHPSIASAQTADELKVAALSVLER